MTSAGFRYVILPALNAHEFPELEEEMRRRGVRCEFSALADGGRVYRVSAEDLALLPHDEDGPYFGDADSGHSLNALPDEIWERTRRDRRGLDWVSVQDAAPAWRARSSSAIR